jgi:hypothetical protein
MDDMGRPVTGADDRGTGPDAAGHEPGAGAASRRGRDGEAAGKRPLLERLGMAAVALVIALLFGAIALASWAGGEGFLAVMAALGSAMTLWAGALTVRRG